MCPPGLPQDDSRDDGLGPADLGPADLGQVRPDGESSAAEHSITSWISIVSTFMRFKGEPYTRGQFSFPRRCSHLSPADPLLDPNITEERRNKGKARVNIFNLQHKLATLQSTNQSTKCKVFNSEFNCFSIRKRRNLISKSESYFKEKEVRRPAPVQQHCDAVPPGQDRGHARQLQEGHQGRWHDAGRRLHPVCGRGELWSISHVLLIICFHL